MPTTTDQPGEERTYTVRLYFFKDSGPFDRTGWRAAITNPAGVQVKEFTRCWSQRRARNKARRWVRKRVLETTKVVMIEVLEGS